MSFGDCVTVGWVSTGGLDAFAFGAEASEEAAAAEGSVEEGAGLVGVAETRVAAGSVSAADGASFASAEDSLTEVAEAGTKVPANAREKTIPALIATLEKALCEVQCFFCSLEQGLFTCTTVVPSYNSVPNRSAKHKNSPISEDIGEAKPEQRRLVRRI